MPNDDCWSKFFYLPARADNNHMLTNKSANVGQKSTEFDPFCISTSTNLIMWMVRGERRERQVEQIN